MTRLHPPPGWKSVVATVARRPRRWLGESIDLAAYIAVRMLVAVVQTLPVDMGDALCRGLARLAAGPLRVRSRTTDENLRQVFPDSTAETRRELSRRMWHHLLLMVCEIAWAQRRLHLCNWHQHVTFRQNRTMLAHLLSDRPIVMVTGHFGNFEIGGYVTGLMGFSSLAIARRLDNRYLHDWVERFRSAKGQRMIDKEGCADDVDRHLQNGGMLSLLADQHAGPKGCWVNFLGVPASSHKALALFSLRSNAPMIVGTTRRVDRQPMQFESYCTGVADPLDDSEEVCQSVGQLTQWYNDRLAVAIAASTEQYWWLHRRWRAPPAKIAKRLARAA